MMEKLISRLAFTLKAEMSASEFFPFSDRKLHPTKQFKPHMKKIAFDNNPIVIVSPKLHYFELGNEYAEEKAPYYHILEDAKTIRNPYQSTSQTRGSQASVRPKAKRDYSVGTINAEGVITPEYRGSFSSGKRSYMPTYMKLVDKNYEKRFERSKFRYNVHFAYIERILENILPNVARLSGLTLYSSPKGLNMRETAPKEMRMDTADLVASMMGE